MQIIINEITYKVNDLFGKSKVIKIYDKKNTKSKSFRKYILFECNCGANFERRTDQLINKNFVQCRSCSSKEVGYKRSVMSEVALINDIYRRYEKSAGKREICFDLSLENFKNLIFDNCYYCASFPSNVFNKISRNGKIRSFCYNGIDRLDNLYGYNDSNCVSCCKTCNVAKSNLSLTEWFRWIIRLSENIESALIDQMVSGSELYNFIENNEDEFYVTIA